MNTHYTFTDLLSSDPLFSRQSIPDTVRLSLQYLLCYVLSVILLPCHHFADRHAFYFFIALVPYLYFCLLSVPVRNIFARSGEIMLRFPGTRRLSFVSRFSLSYVIDQAMRATRVGRFWVQAPPIDAFVCLVWCQSFH